MLRYFLLVISHFFLSIQAQDSQWPNKLSELPIFQKNNEIWSESAQSLPYVLNATLFSDYALKLRTIYIPQSSIDYIRIQPSGDFEFPVGTMISKSFFYSPKDIAFISPIVTIPFDIDLPIIATGLLSTLNGNIPIETRVLKKTTNGWIGISYVWDMGKNDAFISEIGQQIPMSYNGENFTYLVPDKNQCLGCHIHTKDYKKTIKPIGPRLENMDVKQYPWDEQKPQLQIFYEMKWFDPNQPIPQHTNPWPNLSNSEETKNIEHATKAYLHINCAHCHTSTGAAKSSGLFLDFHQNNPTKRGICKAPVAAGNAGGGHPYVIYPGKSQKSLLIHRIKSNDPQTKMPEIGRGLVDKQGVDLVSQYIDSLVGNCNNKKQLTP